jgi:hypothetical protein
VAHGVSFETRQVDHRHIRREALESGGFRTSQHVADEQRVPSILCEDAGFQLMARIGPGEQVLDVEFAAFGVRQEVGIEHVELSR